MSPEPLPTVEQWLSALVPRVRALRVAQGTNRLVAAALGLASAVLLLDAGFVLAAWVRGLFLSVWLTAVGVMTWRWVLVPWRGEMPLAEVAHEVGKRLPELGEQLRGAIHNAPDARPAETARELAAVDPAQAIPVKSVGWLVAGALLAVLAVAATTTLVPGTGDRLRRVAAPWSRPNTPPFRVIVTSGEPVVRRGGPVTLTAYVERIGSGRAAPPEAVLVTRDSPDAPETRTPMSGDAVAFHATCPCVAADFEYRVEIGAARSEWFRVSVLDAVDLAPGTAIEITPPEYATTVPKRTLATLADFDGLQHGTVVFRLKFTQPAAAGHLDWRPLGDIRTETIALEFAPDRLGATARFPLRGSGVLKLVLVREADGKRLPTHTAANVRVVADEPPRFEELSGVTTRPRTVRPGSRITISFVATDDLSVTRAELQYVIGPDESKRETVPIPIPLDGAGTPRASGWIAFALPDRAREGDTVRFHVAVFDNFHIFTNEARTAMTGPQGTGFPRGSGWSELRISATAPPLDEQDVVCVRDALYEALAGAIKALKEVSEETTALSTATAGTAALEYDQTVRLNKAGEQLRAATAALRDDAHVAALTPELRSVASAVREVVDQMLRPAEAALRRAETDSPAARAEAFGAAIAHLRAADAKLNELVVRNNQHARARLDRLKLAALAADQTALGAEKIAGADLVARQGALLGRLTALLAESDPLRAAYDGAKAEEIRRLAVALNELAAHLRELDAAAKQNTADARAALLTAITRDQDALAKLAAALFAKMETAARLTGVAPPRPDDFLRVAKLAAAGKTVEALAEIEQHALALSRIAATFEKLAAERADPKFAAKQLAQWQDDLLSRFRAANNAGGFAALPNVAKDAFRAEQKALAGAVEALSLPPDESVKSARVGALLHTESARTFLAGDGAGAEGAMKAAVKSLAQLSERTPSIGDRLNKTQRDLALLRLDLETSANAVDMALRGFDRQPVDAAACAAFAKKLAPQVEKQRKLIAGALALDLPTHAERQARVAVALKAAVSDLESGSPFDVQASQLWVRREFERLKLALEGTPPPDARAEDLFRKLVATAEVLDAHGPTLTARLAEVALPVVQDANGQFAKLVAPEAPALVNDARAAILSAEAAFRDAGPDDTRRKVRAAADALGRLADRLNGFESDVERVKRLAALRRAAAEKPKDLLTFDEPGRQLVRETEELTNTRVGAAGQPIKKRALDLYAKLRAKTDPDRVGTELKALATALDELAAKMADVAELTAGFARPAPTPPGAADAFLPSQSHALALRDLEKRQRALQVQVANLAAELAGRLRPAATNPFPPLEAEQRAILRDALDLAKELGSDAATKAAASAAQAADRLRVARVVAAKEDAEHAANFFRQLATDGGEKPWGKRAADLVKRQDAVLTELAALFDQPDAIAAQQVARTNELARVAGELATRLALAAESFDATDSAHKALVAVATAAKEAEKRLTEAARKATDGSAADAEKSRAGASDSLQTAAEAISGLALPPPGTPTAVGEALRDAERAMRKAIAERDAERARKAAEALGRVMK